MRRWHAGWTHTEAGVDFRVVPGKKDVRIVDGKPVTDDLRIEWRGASRTWVAIPFSAVFLLVDFFAENEEVRTKSQPHWRVDGGDYFMRSVEKSRRVGWEQTNREDVLEPRARLEGTSAPAAAVQTFCGSTDPEGGRCVLAPGHTVAHKSGEYVWPVAA